jgi:hypothetical protein
LSVALEDDGAEVPLRDDAVVVTGAGWINAEVNERLVAGVLPLGNVV